MAVVLRATLSNGHLQRRVIRVGDHCAHPVETCRKAFRDCGANLSTGVGGCVDSLEESELGGIKRLSRAERTPEILQIVS